jgi:hypothetical protein
VASSNLDLDEDDAGDAAEEDANDGVSIFVACCRAFDAMVTSNHHVHSMIHIFRRTVTKELNRSVGSLSKKGTTICLKRSTRVGSTLVN